MPLAANLLCTKIPIISFKSVVKQAWISKIGEPGRPEVYISRHYRKFIRRRLGGIHNRQAAYATYPSQERINLKMGRYSTIGSTQFMPTVLLLFKECLLEFANVVAQADMPLPELAVGIFD